jgi:protein-S-isoprenylcysteine O-methyltransferase Ste14
MRTDELDHPAFETVLVVVIPVIMVVIPVFVSMTFGWMLVPTIVLAVLVLLAVLAMVVLIATVHAVAHALISDLER